MGGSLAWGITRLGRWVENAERGLFGAVAWLFRSVWAVVWFIPGLLLGKKRSRRTRHKFLS
ncbi:MAG: hypothetical protein R3C49_26325 [Planctomycetaceae bacterium]